MAQIVLAIDYLQQPQNLAPLGDELRGVASARREPSDVSYALDVLHQLSSPVELVQLQQDPVSLVMALRQFLAEQRVPFLQTPSAPKPAV